MIDKLPESWKPMVDAVASKDCKYTTPCASCKAEVEKHFMDCINAALEAGVALEGGPDLPGVQNAAHTCIILQLDTPK